MWIADTSIRRPVMTVMGIGRLMLLGYISLDRLGVDLFPQVEFPYVIVETRPRRQNDVSSNANSMKD